MSGNEKTVYDTNVSFSRNDTFYTREFDDELYYPIVRQNSLKPKR